MYSCCSKKSLALEEQKKLHRCFLCQLKIFEDMIKVIKLNQGNMYFHEDCLNKFHKTIVELL